ncbi:protocatechuate 3,4-dioxygenase subunit beta [Bordetella hinzii]|uniref:Protocatechuate 3,4-dioxygenase subunit beta n=2 Tax=Bordetella hinzii TaxID=103855 RepID=A0AAN1RVB7_9BORD|nr:protocatechuate 3,4-dioxygenase subunit beta [Bordetella hinzii]AKQ54220.1 Protocatechuate 3,4-dioxygenase beta chain [Bordetella hinzii]AKQ58734.1 Protocatechuate 3,4-dioxygenase beta chain [Bordetella hinzii]AZW15982.1 protocatechuate 3,4-dioxygenase subunit beta [Bordetella hinzii]KCB25928.1 protocatechuate 3,4-dioxygenase, beta subunit [Bordetella hinzii OH87 BAL007II]KCB28924.1 protocatechuate 3,4-dioxygenase, beta subunit [Bordetella hinzii L60]
MDHPEPGPILLADRDWPQHPPYKYPDYKSSILRSPTRALMPVPAALKDLRAPVYGAGDLGAHDHDLTVNAAKNGAPLGERIIVTGRVLDESGRPLPHTLVEIWQANAAGRYVHKGDQHDAPLDPNFLGAGRCLTDKDGRYHFLTIKPGAYPWGNHSNAWRPNHIHFSLFGQYFGSRLVTQMYFPGDPLLALDPIFQGTPAHARDRLVSRFALEHTREGYALAYEFDIVLRGARQTPME